MYFFLDTNIFHDNWFLAKADFTYLFNFISNTQSALLVPEVVLQEVENNRRKELETTISDLKSQLAKAQKLNTTLVVYDFNKLNQPYSFTSVLEGMPGEKIFIPYNDISQEIVVARALKTIRPFREEDKGYRDTLIWLSILEFFKKKDYDGEVIFISRNPKDFFGDSIDLHYDLKKDLTDYKLKCSFRCFLTLLSFIEGNVDKAKHQVAHDELYERYLLPLEGELKTQTEFTLNTMTSVHFLEFIRSANEKFPFVDNLIGHDFDCWEGVEDAQIHGYENLSGHSVYIRYYYHLRRCTIILTISLGDYLRSKADIDKYYTEVEVKDDKVELSKFARAAFTASFSLDTKAPAIEGLNIETIDLDTR